MPALCEKDTGYAWWIVFGSLCIQTCTGGILYGIFSFLIKDWQDEFNIKKSEAALMASLTTGFGFFIATMAAFAVNKYGYRPVDAVGTVMTVLGLLLSSIVGEFWQLYLTQLVTGFGIGAVYISATTIVSQWFDKKRAFANGVSSAGIGLGVVIFSLLTSNLKGPLGWRVTLRWLMIPVGVLLSIGSAILVKNGMTRPPLGFGVHWFKNGLFCRLLGFGFLTCFAQQLGSMLLPDFVTNQGYSDSAAGIAMLIQGAVQIPGRPIVGKLGGIFGGVRNLIFWNFIKCASIIVVAWAVSYWEFILYSVIFGLSSSAFWALTPVVFAECFGPDALATTLGWLYLVYAVAALTSPPVGGAIADATGSLKVPFIVGGCLGMTGWFLLFGIKKSQEDAKAAKLREQESLNFPQHYEKALLSETETTDNEDASSVGSHHATLVNRPMQV